MEHDDEDGAEQVATAGCVCSIVGLDGVHTRALNVICASRTEAS